MSRPSDPPASNLRETLLEPLVCTRAAVSALHAAVIAIALAEWADLAEDTMRLYLVARARLDRVEREHGASADGGA